MEERLVIGLGWSLVGKSLVMVFGEVSKRCVLGNIKILLEDYEVIVIHIIFLVFLFCSFIISIVPA